MRSVVHSQVRFLVKTSTIEDNGQQEEPYAHSRARTFARQARKTIRRYQRDHDKMAQNFKESLILDL